MRVTTNDDILLTHSEHAFEQATADVLADARATAPRRTGEYAASLILQPTAQGDILHTSIGSPLPQGGAVEHGADVGARRGPHMAGAHTTGDAVGRFSTHMVDRLRSTPV